MITLAVRNIINFYLWKNKLWKSDTKKLYDTQTSKNVIKINKNLLTRDVFVILRLSGMDAPLLDWHFSNSRGYKQKSKETEFKN